MYLYESEKLIHITGFSKKMIFLRPFSFLLQTAFILEKCVLKESETQVLQEVELMVLIAGQFRIAVWRQLTTQHRSLVPDSTFRANPMTVSAPATPAGSAGKR
jgi:hypothetical protein